MDTTPEKKWLIPAAIILAGVILAIAVFMIRINTVGIPDGGSPDAIRPVSTKDHLVGNPNAPVTVVEYSDIDSEFGKEFHTTMAQLMTEYAPAGKVAWVYRHFPLTTVHRYSLSHAHAAECAGSLAGEDAFWRFIDLLNAAAPGAAEFDPEGYPSILAQLGIAESTFNECTTSGRFSAQVLNDAHNALAAGAEGAPFVVILTDGADPVVIQGGMPYRPMKEAIQRAIAKTANP